MKFDLANQNFLLTQVSQYTFAMCSYREKKSEPQELMQLEGYTVDYTAPHPGTLYAIINCYTVYRMADLFCLLVLGPYHSRPVNLVSVT